MAGSNAGQDALWEVVHWSRIRVGDYEETGIVQRVIFLSV